MSGLGEEGRYRILLIRIGDNTEEEKDAFCHDISKNHNIPFPLLKKIVDHSPIVLKKNLSLKKAVILAKTFNASGATVSVEKRIDFPPVSLEFQELVPHQLDLESSSLQKTQRGAWSVVGRVKNISDETLHDTWVLIQLFDNFEDFVTFEETPLPINPLPSGETSPFKVVFEGDFPIKRISVGFKNASGQPVAALDRRKKKEWERVEIGDEHFPPTSQTATAVEGRSQPIELYGSKEQINKEDDEGYSDIMPASLVSNLGLSSRLTEETGNQLTLPVSEELAEKAEEESTLNDLKTLPDKEVTEGSQCDPSFFKESIQSLEVISGEVISGEVISGEVISGKDRVVEPPPFPWIEDFREAVETFYQELHDIFLIWFEEYQKEGEFKNSLHTLLTILVYSRFDQRDQSIKALENTKRVFRLITHPNLLREDIPPLEGTPFVSGEVWRELFHRALPKIQQIGNAILERKKWSTFDLEQIIQVIPHVSHLNSRKATQWINRLIPEAVEVDLSDALISVGESLYRVASRLGIVDPYFDYYQDRYSPGDIKIQSFAKMAFPENPMKSEEPMAGMGRDGEQRGHCFTTQPRCEGCLFEGFCPRLHIHFDPSAIGMRD